MLHIFLSPKGFRARDKGFVRNTASLGTGKRAEALTAVIARLQTGIQIPSNTSFK